eukprot:1149753-Pelagomonas_calceolata.AAC.7
MLRTAAAIKEGRMHPDIKAIQCPEFQLHACLDQACGTILNSCAPCSLVPALISHDPGTEKLAPCALQYLGK